MSPSSCPQTLEMGNQDKRYSVFLRVTVDLGPWTERFGRVPEGDPLSSHVSSLTYLYPGGRSVSQETVVVLFLQ